MQTMTTAAALYAIRELGRRAGASPSFIASWKVAFTERGLDLMPAGDDSKTIRFPYGDQNLPWESSDKLLFETRAWMQAPSETIGRVIPDFIVPCTSHEHPTPVPLFRRFTPDVIECTANILRFTLFTLSREEEQQTQARDQHGRFPASESVAFKSRYLQRPVIDEYGLAVQQALTHLLPGWRPQPRNLRVKLSHDIDLVGLPFRWRATIGHTARRGNPYATMVDIASTVTAILPTYLQLVLAIVEMSRSRGLDSAIYWKAANFTPWDTGYDICHPKVRKVIGQLEDCGVEMGLHPGYYTYLQPAELFAEVQRIRQLLGARQLGGRQHYLRWAPATWIHWEQAGLSYDSTVGFADQAGFRAGTCVPYHPWLWSEDRESSLLEIPLIVMDGTLIDYMKLDSRSSLDLVRLLVDRCHAVGGVFTMLWHNSSLLEPAYKTIFPAILDGLCGGETYDWRSDLPAWPVPTVTSHLASE